MVVAYLKIQRGHLLDGCSDHQYDFLRNKLTSDVVAVRYVVIEADVFSYHNTEGCEMRRLISPLVRDNGPFLLLRITLSDIGNQLCNLLSPLIVTSRNTSPASAPFPQTVILLIVVAGGDILCRLEICVVLSHTLTECPLKVSSRCGIGLQILSGWDYSKYDFCCLELILIFDVCLCAGYLQKELTLCRREYKIQETLQTIEILLASIRSSVPIIFKLGVGSQNPITVELVFTICK